MAVGRPMFEATPQDRLAVTTLSACGTRHALIARHLQIDEKTLKKHFRKELSKGREDANAMVARSLFSAAVGGNITAAIFWLKTRAGWKETQINEFVGANGERLLQQPFDLGISFADGGPGRQRPEGSTPGSDIDGVYVTAPQDVDDHDNVLSPGPPALSAPRAPVEPKPVLSKAEAQWAALSGDSEVSK